MRVHFDRDRMAAVQETHDRWWRGEVERPLTSITITDAYPEAPCAAPALSQENCTDFSYSAEEVIEASAGKLLRSVRLFDIYRGVGVPEGKKSVAFSLELRADDRTLTDGDSEAVMTKVLAAVQEKLGAALR